MRRKDIVISTSLAKAQRFHWDIHILGINLSRAFDTFRRDQLMSVLKEVVNEDGLRLIQYQLSGTKLHVRLRKTSSPTFPTTIGTPQGDSLSPVLFTVYLEAALQQLRKEAAQRPYVDLHLPLELIYADDTDFVSTSRRWLSQLEATTSSTLVQWSFNMNHDKTEDTAITRLNDRNKEEWRLTRKLASLIGDDEDVLRRKQLATAAFRGL